MKHIFLSIGISIIGFIANAQSVQPLTIEDCYALARQNYPLAKRQDLIQKSAAYSIENASKGYLPQFSVGGQATYQSDVTQIPLKLPGADIPMVSKDQYKIFAQADQTIFDGGMIRLQKQSLQAAALVDQQQLMVDLYKLKERINQLFFGILLIDEQLAQTALRKNDIGLGLAKTSAAIANGIALKTNADILQAELLKTDQQSIELKATRSAYMEMLGSFINQPLNENSLLKKPPPISGTGGINRPELQLFDSQQKLDNIKNNLIKARNLPKLGLFVQGGYGRPALNMLKNDFTGYYIGGIKLNWSLAGLYTSKKEKALLDNDRRSIDIQRETFLFNTGLELKQQHAAINKFQELFRSDDAIILLRGRIKNTALVQLENGVINSGDYLREVNAENQAKEDQFIHELQLLMAQYNQQTTSGN